MSKAFKFWTTPQSKIDRSVETLQAVLYSALRDWTLTVDDSAQIDTWVSGEWQIRLYETSRAVVLIRDGLIQVTLYRQVPEQVLKVLRDYDAPVGA